MTFDIKKPIDSACDGPINKPCTGNEYTEITSSGVDFRHGEESKFFPDQASARRNSGEIKDAFGRVISGTVRLGLGHIGSVTERRITSDRNVLSCNFDIAGSNYQLNVFHDRDLQAKAVQVFTHDEAPQHKDTFATEQGLCDRATLALKLYKGIV